MQRRANGTCSWCFDATQPLDPSLHYRRRRQTGSGKSDQCRGTCSDLRTDLLSIAHESSSRLDPPLDRTQAISHRGLSCVMKTASILVNARLTIEHQADFCAYLLRLLKDMPEFQTYDKGNMATDDPRSRESRIQGVRRITFCQSASKSDPRLECAPRSGQIGQ